MANIDIVCMGCKNVPRSTICGEVEEFAILARNTSKPLEYLCENVESLAAVIDMAAAVRGTHEALREKPYFLQTITPLPLMYWRCHVDQVDPGGAPRYTANHRHPADRGAASAPITMAGCIVNSLATDFAGMVLAQLAARGCFAIGSSDVRFMEPSTGGMGNVPQTWLADAAVRQGAAAPGPALLLRHCRSFRGASVQDMRRCLGDIGIHGSGLLQPPRDPRLSGTDRHGIAFSLHALCLCDEIAGLLRTMWQGLRVDADTLALDLAHSVGPRGNYLAQAHTARHCREQLWPAHSLGPHLPLSMGNLPDEDLFERIDAALRRILAEHRPAPLAPALLSQLDQD